MVSSPHYVQSRYGCTLPMSNEDWQFEKPLLRVSADGQVLENRLAMPERTKANMPELKPINEAPVATRKKEGESVNFNELPKEEQLRRVAEEYNAGTPVVKIAAKLGTNTDYLYKCIHEARKHGIITEPRTERAGRKRKEAIGAIPAAPEGPTMNELQQEPEPEPEPHQEPEQEPAATQADADYFAPVTSPLVHCPIEEPRATVEDFLRTLEEVKERAWQYAERVEKWEQASKIAQAMDELLGEKAGKMLAELYMEVAG